MSYRNTYLKVNSKNLIHNLNYYKNTTKKDVFAVVKANAYGLGIIEISKLFENQVNYLAVATLDEALLLRKNNIKTNILVMGYTSINDISLATKNNITLTIIDNAWANDLKKANIKNLKLHLKINTSMNRLGISDLATINQVIDLLKDDHKIEGIYTHFCCNDKFALDADFNIFRNIVENINFNFKYIHCSSSNSSLILKEDFTNAVRIGIGLYTQINQNLLDVASLYSHIVLIRDIKKGQGISYDHKYVAKQDVKVAIVPIGYADGILRADSGILVKINNKLYPVIGNVCMDQLMVEVDDLVSINDQVEFFGETMSIKNIAIKRNTIHYEVLANISKRVKRIYK